MLLFQSSSQENLAYDKPATLNADHLKAILFSCENIAVSSASNGAAVDRKQERGEHEKLADD